MPDDSSFDRLDIAQWVGTLLWITLLESHVISRPLVFLLGPFVVLLCMVLIASPLDSRRLRRTCVITGLLSIGGFLLTRYVFK